MRQLGNETYSVVVAPSVWKKVEAVPAQMMRQAEQALAAIAQRLSEQGDGGPQRLEALTVDGYIVIYEICPARRTVILSSVLRGGMGDDGA